MKWSRLVLLDGTVVEIPDDAIDVGASRPKIIAHLTEDALPVEARCNGALWSSGTARHRKCQTQTKKHGKCTDGSTFGVRTHGPSHFLSGCRRQDLIEVPGCGGFPSEAPLAPIQASGGRKKGKSLQRPSQRTRSGLFDR